MRRHTHLLLPIVTAILAASMLLLVVIVVQLGTLSGQLRDVDRGIRQLELVGLPGPVPATLTLAQSGEPPTTSQLLQNISDAMWVTANELQAIRGAIVGDDPTAPARLIDRLDALICTLSRLDSSGAGPCVPATE